MSHAILNGLPFQHQARRPIGIQTGLYDIQGCTHQAILPLQLPPSSPLIWAHSATVKVYLKYAAVYSVAVVVMLVGKNCQTVAIVAAFVWRVRLVTIADCC